MRKNIITLFSSIIVGFAFVFGGADLIKILPEFGCVEFGCIGIAILYITIFHISIPIIFGALRFVVSKENRFKQAFHSFMISLIVMALFFLLIFYYW